MAEIAPKPGFEGNFNPFPPGSEGSIAAPFIAVTNLIDYTKDLGFDGSIEYGIFVRTNGNTDVDNSFAPGGTLRYIDREFTNVQVTFNQAIHFPPVPQIMFPPDDFDDGIIAPFWDLVPATGLVFNEENGVLKLSGIPEEDKFAFFITSRMVRYQRQDAVVQMDFKAPTGIQANPACLFRLQFDFSDYIEVGVYNDGYRLTRVIANEVEASGSLLPLFGNERTEFHRFQLSYKDATGHVEAFVDDIPLGGIDDKRFSSSFVNFEFAFYSSVVHGQYIEREWDNFTSSGAWVYLYLPILFFRY